MKNIRIAICEDNPADADQLIKHLKNAENELKIKTSIQIYRNGTDFLSHFCPEIDMIFLDVQLPDMDGDEIAARIRNLDKSVYLVFISRHISFFSIGFAHEAKNYLLKPLSYTQLMEEMRKYLRYDKEPRLSCLWITNKKETHKIYLSRLRYIETENRRLILHYDNDIIYYTDKISDFIKRLPEQSFFRCNTSYIVNLYYVHHIVPDINRYCIHLHTGEVLPLSRNKKKALLLHLQKAGEHPC